MISEEGSESSGIVPNTRNYFVRLFFGDISLVVTYWVWGVLIGGAAFAIVSFIIDQNYLQIVATPYGEQLVTIFDWAWFGVGIFIWIAIWNSAGKYEGKFWGGFARFMVFVAVVTTANEWIAFYEGGG